MHVQQIRAQVFNPADDDEVDGMHAVRYEFELTGPAGDKYSFLIDLPITTERDNTVDIWMHDSTVAVGDSPEDGFATFTPLSETIGVVSDDVVNKG